MAWLILPYAYKQHINSESGQKAQGVRRGQRVQIFASWCIQKQILNLDVQRPQR
jgi:hypothetical protein